MKHTSYVVLSFFAACFGCADPKDDFGNLAGRPEHVTEQAELSSPEQEELRAFIGRVIEAHGGEENIRRLRTGRVEIQGRGAFAPGITGDFALVDTFQFPDKVGREVKGRIDDEEAEVLFVASGDKVWMRHEGGVLELPTYATQHKPIPYSFFHTLLEARDGAYRLTRREGDEPHVALIDLEKEEGYYGTIVVDSQDQTLLGNYNSVFDPEAREWVTVTTDFEELAWAEGVLVPSKIKSYKDDTLLFDIEILAVKALASVDEGLFAKPE